ncbi:MAG: hypothetical protein WEB06_13670 [Actinomycetota bacterium]
MSESEIKFGKSLSNRRVESAGLHLLLLDPRFQAPDLQTKRRIVTLLPVGAFGIQTFDAVMTTEPCEALTVDNIDGFLPNIRLVEMKTTKKPIRDEALNGFFFGATEREYAMARALGDKYLFAFVVLNENNAYGRRFFVLLTLDQIERRTRAKRIQYQVNFRSDIVADPDAPAILEPAVFRAAEDVEPYGEDD